MLSCTRPYLLPCGAVTVLDLSPKPLKVRLVGEHRPGTQPGPSAVPLSGEKLDRAGGPAANQLARVASHRIDSLASGGRHPPSNSLEER